MPVVAGIISGTGALLGGGLGYLGQTSAAKKQGRTAENMYNATAALNAPYLRIGNAALQPLAALYGIGANFGPGGAVTEATPEQRQAAMDMFYSSPEYTIQKQALDQALMRQAAATGTRYSPSTALGQAEIAGRTFGDWRNNLASLAQMGPAAANQQAAALTNLGTGLSNAAVTRGNAMTNLGGNISDMLGGIGSNVASFRAKQREWDRLSQLLSGMGNNDRWQTSFDIQPTNVNLEGINW